MTNAKPISILNRVKKFFSKTTDESISEKSCSNCNSCTCTHDKEVEESLPKSLNEIVKYLNQYYFENSKLTIISKKFPITLNLVGSNSELQEFTIDINDSISNVFEYTSEELSVVFELNKRAIFNLRELCKDHIEG